MMVDIEPDSLVFRDVKLNQAQTASLCVSNPLTVTLEFTIRSSSSKYTISPNKVTLSAGQSIIVTVRLFVAHYSNYRKGVEGQSDTIHIKSPYFEQKIPVTFLLQPRDYSRSRSSSPVKSRHASPTISSGASVRNSREMTSEPVDDPIMELSRQLKLKDKKIKQLEEIVGELENKYPSLQQIVKNRVEQERLVFEEKSIKVLNILHKKDATIAKLQEDLVTAASKIASLQQEVDMLNESVQNSEGKGRDYWTGKQVRGSMTSGPDSSILKGLRNDLQEANEKNAKYLNEIKELRKKQEDNSKTPPPPPPQPLPRGNHEVQSLREKCADQAEQIEVLVSELSRIRADSTDSRISHTSSQQQILDLQSELRHQHERYRDLKDAYESLEKVKLNASSLEQPRSHPASRNYEENFEGGFSTSTPFNLGNQDTNNSKFLMTAMMEDRRIQMELYQERAEVAERNLEDIRNQLVDIIEVERDQKKRIDELEGMNRSKDMELHQLTERIHSLQQENEHAKTLLEHRDLQLSQSKKLSDNVLTITKLNDAHHWWGYVWHELKKLGNYGVTTTNVLSLSGIGGTASDFAVVEARLKDSIRQQAIELANVRQDLLGKKLLHQKEVAALKDQLESCHKDIIRLNQQLRSQKAEKDIKMQEMASTIRSISGRTDLHGLVAVTKQDLETERLTVHHLKSEIESYKNTITTQQAQISSCRKEIANLKTMNESLEVIGTMTGVPGVDAATLIEVMSGQVIHLQLELSKAKSSEIASKAHAASYQRLDLGNAGDNPTESNISDDSLQLNINKRNSGPSPFTTYPDTPTIDPIVMGSSKEMLSNPQKLLDNLDAALLAQKVLHQESTISSLQSQIYKYQQMLQKSEQDRVTDRENYESNEKISYDSQRQQYVLLQDAYDSMKEEISLLRKKLSKAEKRNVDLQAAVIEQDLYHRTISSIDIPSNESRESKENHADAPDNLSLSEELEKIKKVLRERTTQLKVLMETMDSLQYAGIVQENHQLLTDSPSSQGAWVTQALVKRVVELTAEFTSASATIAIEERRRQQLESDLQRKNHELNQLKANIKRDDEGIVKMKQQITALTSQLRDTEKQRIEMQYAFTEDNEKLIDRIKEEELQVSSMKLRIEELEQQLQVYETENSNHSEDYKKWIETILFEKDFDKSKDIPNISNQDASKPPVSDVNSSDMKSLIVSLLKQWRNGNQMNHSSDMTSEDLFAAITTPTGQLISAAEQHFLSKITDLVLTANNKCLQAISNHQNAIQKNFILQQQLTIMNNRFGVCLKQLHKYRRRVFVMSQNIVKETHQTALQQSKLVTILRKSLTKERDEKFIALNTISTLSKHIKTLEIKRIAETSQLHTLQAKVVELEVQRLPGLRNSSSSLRSSESRDFDISLNVMMSKFESQLKEQEKSLQQWFHVELPRLVSGLPVTEDTIPLHESYEKRYNAPIVSKLTKDLGLDRTYALAQSLCATKAIQATIELKLSNYIEKCSILEEQNVLLQGIISRWKQDIDYIHRIRQDGGVSSPLKQYDLEDAILSNLGEAIDYNRLESKRSDRMAGSMAVEEGKESFVEDYERRIHQFQQKQLDKEEEVIELKTRLEHALNRIEQQQIVIRDTIQEEHELKDRIAQEISQMKVQLTEEYNRKLLKIRSEYDEKYHTQQKQLADDMSVLEQLVLDSQKNHEMNEENEKVIRNQSLDEGGETVLASTDRLGLHPKDHQDGDNNRDKRVKKSAFSLAAEKLYAQDERKDVLRDEFSEESISKERNQRLDSDDIFDDINHPFRPSSQRNETSNRPSDRHNPLRHPSKNQATMTNIQEYRENSSDSSSSKSEDIDLLQRNHLNVVNDLEHQIHGLSQQLDLEKQKNRQEKAEIQELQHLVQFQRELLDRLQSTASNPLKSLKNIGIQVSNNDIVTYDDSSEDVYEVNEEKIQLENMIDWPSPQRLLEKMVKAIRNYLNSSKTSLQLNKRLLERIGEDAIRVKILILKMWDDLRSTTDRMRQNERLIERQRAAQTIDRHTNTEEASQISAADDQIQSSLQELTNRVKELEGQLTATAKANTSNVSNTSANAVTIPDSYIKFISELRIKVSELESQHEEAVDRMRKQQYQNQENVLHAEKEISDLLETLNASERSSREKIDRLHHENGLLHEEIKQLKSQLQGNIAGQKTQLYEIKERYETTLKEAQEAMELQTSATKEQINRLQSQLKRALEMASSSAQKSAETVQSNHIASQQALKLEYEEENNRLRKFVDETVKSLDATREQQQEQQLLYRRQIHELSAVYNRTKLAQEEIIRCLERQLDDLKSSPDSSRNDQKVSQSHPAIATGRGHEDLTDRVRLLEFRYQSKNAELEAVMRALTKSVNTTSSIVVSDDSYSSMPMRDMDMASTSRPSMGQSKPSTTQSHPDHTDIEQIRQYPEDIRYEVYEARILAAEGEVHSLNLTLASERRTTTALREQVMSLQQQNERLLSIPTTSVTSITQPNQDYDSQRLEKREALKESWSGEDMTSKPQTNDDIETATTQTNADIRPDRGLRDQSMKYGSANHINESKATPPAHLRDVFNSVDNFLQLTAHEIVSPSIQSNTMNTSTTSESSAVNVITSRAVANATSAIYSSIQDKMKGFMKRVNDMRKHARSEIIRLRDLLLSAHEANNSELKTLESTNNELKQQVATLREDSTRKAKLISTLKVARSSDTVSIKRAQDETKELDENVKRLNRAVQSKDNLIKSMKAKIQLLEDTLDKMGIEINSQATNIGSSGPTGSTEPVNDLKNRLRIAELERTRTQQRLSSLKDKISELESDNKSMTEELDRLRQMNMKVEGLKTTIKNKDMAMKQFKDEIDLVTGQYEDLKEKMDEKRVDTERQIRELHDDLERYRRITHDLEKENQLLRIRLAAQTQALNMAALNVPEKRVSSTHTDDPSLSRKIDEILNPNPKNTRSQYLDMFDEEDSLAPPAMQPITAFERPHEASNPSQSNRKSQSIAPDALPTTLSTNAADIHDVMMALSTGNGSVKTEASAATDLEQKLKGLVKAALSVKSNR